MALVAQIALGVIIGGLTIAFVWLLDCLLPEQLL
jgi:hypothetical protein